LLLASAAAMLAYSGYVTMDAWIFQKAQSRQLDNPPPAGQATSGPAGLLGRIAIPRLGVSVIVAEGVDAVTLRRAAGHIPGSALPGQLGNIGISGHRDTFFRPLRNIRRYDQIIVTTPLARYYYRVLSTRIVSPSNLSVLAPSEDEILTLITCYPFYFIGSAPERFIVRAERVYI
jgi:sortase A